MKINVLKHMLPIAGLAFLAACNLTKDVDVVLPDYARQPVVECYLEPGKPFRLLLTQSYSFFDPFGLDSSFLDKTLLQNAFVTISYNGRTDTLYNQLAFESNPVKIFNYIGTNVVPASVGTEYVLNIVLENGGAITGRASMLPRVPIDSVVVSWSPDRDTLARVLTYITDDLNQTDYYRRMLHYSSLDSVPEQDFLVNDRISTEALIAFGTGYELTEGDTVFNTIFHISKEYHDYAESYQLAAAGAGNPFAQPSQIKSNVSGSANPLGIFTCLVYDRDTTIIHR
ncbi:MAG TPA: DUF4249 family protein [Saprospiraceae bacterium]|nr:DUF4249 family protein [Saprospiraceae bacterium]HPI08771.1 DUF4249 family protein [Saprospiraceae bacterium]